MSIAVGNVLLNQYRILERIGEGGMARVWLAQKIGGDSHLFAIKEPRSDLAPADQEEIGRRFAREVEVCARLAEWGTPNIVHTYPALSYNNSQLLVMDYMPGGDLATRIAKHSKGMPFEEVIAIASSLLTALESVHNHPFGIVHRDIKPSNVLFDKNNVAHLADFGLAQIATRSEGRTKFNGTAHPGTSLYKAPEQEESRGYLTSAADLFALGCVLFEMLTGKRYKDQSSHPPVSKLRTDTPVWLEQWVSKALEQFPQNRYQSAEEMLKALEIRGKGATSLVKSKPEVVALIEQRSEPERKNPEPIPVAPRTKNRNWVYALAVLALALLTLNLYQSQIPGEPTVGAPTTAPIVEVSDPAIPTPIVVAQNLPAPATPTQKPTVRATATPRRSTPTPTVAPRTLTPMSVQQPFAPVAPSGNLNRVGAVNSPQLPELKGNIIVCVPPNVASRSTIHLWRLAANQRTWEELPKVSVGVLRSDNTWKIDALPIDATSWSSKGQPYRLELWVNGSPTKSFGNTSAGEAEFRVYDGKDNRSPANAFCNE